MKSVAISSSSLNQPTPIPKFIKSVASIVFKFGLNSKKKQEEVKFERFSLSHSDSDGDGNTLTYQIYNELQNFLLDFDDHLLFCISGPVFSL